jgi:predicted dehydrogenase
MKTVNWGVIGAANIAVERTIPAMAEAPSAVPLALASRDAAKAQALAATLGMRRAYGSFDALLADPDVEAVYIPLPNAHHLEWCIRALEAGKHVLCEKPLCLTTEEVDRLIEVRDRTGRHIEEAFAFRNHPQWRRLAEMLASGDFGRVLSVHGVIAKRFMDPADIRNQPNLGGGVTYDLASYVLSACNLVFGRAPLRVIGVMEEDPVFHVDRLSSGVLDYGDAQATFTASSQGGTAAWGTHQHFSVLCEKGWMRLEFPFAHARPTPCRLYWGDETSVGAFETGTELFPPRNHYALQVERFSRVLLGEPVESWPIEDARLTLRMIEALFASAREGAWRAI